MFMYFFLTRFETSEVISRRCQLVAWVSVVAFTVLLRLNVTPREQDQIYIINCHILTDTNPPGAILSVHISNRQAGRH